MKRVFDVAAAAVLLALASPLLAALVIAVRLDVGKPAIFRQTRIGRGGRPFVLLKLRTMTGPGREVFLPSEDERRLTRLGRWLRSLSLDELPELWNVLRGDMSLVGPRPLPAVYLPRYSAEQARRHEVRPGITGWAQVNGRNRLDWDSRLAMDVWYVDHRSFFLDLRIIVRTLGVVLRRGDISADDAATMHEFLPGAPENAMRDER